MLNAQIRCPNRWLAHTQTQGHLFPATDERHCINQLLGVDPAGIPVDAVASAPTNHPAARLHTYTHIHARTCTKNAGINTGLLHPAAPSREIIGTHEPSQWQHRRKYPEPGWSGHGAAHLALRRGRSPVRVRPRRPCRGWGITQPAYTSETDTRRPAAPLVVRSALPPIIDRRAPRRARGPAPPSSVIAQCRDGHARPLAIASAADRPATVPLLRSGSPPPAAPERACPA